MNRTSNTDRPNRLFTVLLVAGFAVMGALAILSFVNGYLVVGFACVAGFFGLFIPADRRIRKARCKHDDASSGGDRGEH
ncbi:hypothetical protein [Saccharopolyspora taberi]|uniref:Uncharacterized protein n=1 Tax=Saccharopolyspora taberi TaxID=60895 RepID=A0ABN3VFP3_9PSEU